MGLPMIIQNKQVLQLIGEAVSLRHAARDSLARILVQLVNNGEENSPVMQPFSKLFNEMQGPAQRLHLMREVAQPIAPESAQKNLLLKTIDALENYCALIAELDKAGSLAKLKLLEVTSLHDEVNRISALCNILRALSGETDLDDEQINTDKVRGWEAIAFAPHSDCAKYVAGSGGEKPSPSLRPLLAG